jgi:hypothetical protein
MLQDAAVSYIAPTAGPARGISYGESLSSDPRVAELRNREHWFLTVANPREVTALSALRATLASFAYHVGRVCFTLYALSLFAALVTTCALSESEAGNDICRGGLLTELTDTTQSQWAHYFPTMLTALSTLLMAFYCNIATQQYMSSYYACKNLQQRVSDLVAMAVGSMGDKPEATGLLLDVWRSANIVHLSCYALGDKARAVYSFDGFVIPVAHAFGMHDGEERQGMFKQGELDLINQTKTEQAKGLLKELPPQPSGAWGTTIAVAKFAKRVSRLKRQSSMPNEPVSNKRGDVRSRGAVAYRLFSVRLYRLVQEATTQGWTGVTWPAWQSALGGLRQAGGEVQHRGLYRTPQVYRHALLLVVFVTITVDVIDLGTTVGLSFQQGYAFAGTVALLTGLLLALMMIAVTALVGVCMDMEQPFGDDTIDMPALSFVAATAESTLALVVPPSVSSQAACDEITHVDVSQLNADTSFAVSA